MGSILPRKRKDGTIGYTALIRIKKGGKVIHTESETFDRNQAATAWMKKREAELAKPGALDKPTDPTLAEVIDTYSKESLKKHGKTKLQVLRSIKEMPVAQMRCSQIKSPDLVAFARSLQVQPQTRMNYVSHLSSVFLVARPAWGYPLDYKEMEDARIVMKKLGMVSKSLERDRRPTLDELDKLLTHYGVMQLKRVDALPMQRLILFAIFSTRRQEEICRITGKDLDSENLELVVRDMKNPGEKLGNDVRTAITPEALKLIQLQAKGQETIWPYNSQSVSTSFTRACDILGIEDLHFHDLRHEGISRLFELGWTIPRVATVSGHRTWTSLKRYSHMRQVGDKYAGWPWIEKILGK